MNPEIERMVSQKMQEEQALKDLEQKIIYCLQHGICPECGKSLVETEYQESAHGFGWSQDYKCSDESCSFAKRLRHVANCGFSTQDIEKEQ